MSSDAPKTDITIVHLVRHGEVFNPERILYGRRPGYRLSGKGRKQARATAESFIGHNVTYLVASPLQRAQETAQPFSELLDLPVHTDEDLLEAGNQFEGLHIKGIRSQLWNPKRWPLLKHPGQPSWGEPYEDIAYRMMRAVEHARDKAREAGPYSEAICVSHQLPIVCVQRFVQGKSFRHNPATRQCDLASVSSLVYEGDALIDYMYSWPAQNVE